jgi:predicted phosphoribosyltransferase
MADKPRTDATRLAQILDGLADYIENSSDEALLEDTRQQGADPEQIAVHVRGVLKSAVKKHQQRELNRAREEYAQQAEAIRTRTVELPANPKTRRSWLQAVFAQQPRLQLAFTIQNRDFAELTDDDVEANLRKLEILGILKNIKLPEDNG